jgi:hypothetical protein
MNKKLKVTMVILLAIIVIIPTIYFVSFFATGGIFEKDEIELVQITNHKTGIIYKVTSYAGNATASNTLKLYEIKNGNTSFIHAIETFTRYDEEKKSYRVNDSITIVLLTKKGAKEIDTFQLITLLDKTYLQRKKRYKE